MQQTGYQKFEKFEEYARKEPKLKELYWQITHVSDAELACYGLVTKMWFERFKPQLVELVGNRRRTEDELATSEAYQVAYDILFNALPYGNIDEEEYDNDEFGDGSENKSWYVHYLNY